MRKIKVFSGSSHPLLTEAICNRLGTQPAACELTKFSNGETSVNLGTSTRNQDVFIVQSGSQKVNDSVMELLIMISACKGSSAKSITAVMPYFPYSRQSKKKSHRGAITARMLANLLSVAGVHHVITVDLHASPMQGFFAQPVDNLKAEPLIARWIRNNVPGWQTAVVVSKNPGGSKRVTSLADVLKLNFGIITTDRRRSPIRSGTALDTSAILAALGKVCNDLSTEVQAASLAEHILGSGENARPLTTPSHTPDRNPVAVHTDQQPISPMNGRPGTSQSMRSTPVDSTLPPGLKSRPRRSFTVPTARNHESDNLANDYTDERAREVITGRLFQGHIVDDDFPSPILSATSGSMANLRGGDIGLPNLVERDPMASSFMSVISSFQPDNPLGGIPDSTALSDEEEAGLLNPEVEQTVTLVGNVKDKTVLIIDDMIDRSASWIAAAETVVKRGGAQKVYCIATHGLFGEESLEEMEKCHCIDFIVVCNSFPIDPERIWASKKLVILDLSALLAEAMRRNHFGESISQLYQHFQD